MTFYPLLVVMMVFQEKFYQEGIPAAPLLIGYLLEILCSSVQLEFDRPKDSTGKMRPVLIQSIDRRDQSWNR